MVETIAKMHPLKRLGEGSDSSSLAKFLLGNNSEWITIISVIDNLVKGASGQAVQNLNVVMNYPEELGLDNQSLSP